MQLHQIRSTNKQKTKKRVGRGGKRGTFSGRGVKGQKSRAGAKIRPEWRDLVKQTPKMRGYKFRSTQTKPLIINLGFLGKFFKEGEIVSIKSLLERKLISRIKGRMPEVKILGDGEIKKKLSFKGLQISQSAKEKVEKAGGNII
ncbi:MAG: 50S ribosomal protein L15 [Candidatus Portnoybacteria bacterium]|nr:50S ribosomal protein L15 [Candidatus Portnoybacteria bacterium]